KRLTLELDCANNTLPAILSDAIRLRQVLLNLVGNAVKFTQHGAVRLAVEWDADRQRLRFRVTDSGIGIAADQLEAIFQPFNQVDTSSRRRFGGTGLGLTICRRLAQMLGGGIEAASVPGEGSTFTLTLPVRLADEPIPQDAGTQPAADSAGDQPADAAPLAGLEVLVAEDGVDNQRLVRYLLKKAGAEVTIVGDGKQAVGRLLDSGGSRYGVVLMDMQMPVMDGYEATRTLRERGYRGPVIALTAHAMDGDRQKTLDAGCDDYSPKPYNPAELVRLIREHAAAHATPNGPATPKSL
ncbi:MAG: ATP-binding protein, partial [Planctomycetota bacterium]